MKSTALILLLLANAATSWATEKFDTYANPILSGFYPDPSICRSGDDYYLVASSFEYFPGVPIFHSRDLIHWRPVGHCLTRPSQLPLEKMRPSGGIFAPTLRYHNGTFYLITTNVWGGGNFYVTTRDPKGPWSEPVWLEPEGIDPSLFFDDDGTVYYTRHVGAADGYIGQTTLNLETGKLGGKLREIWRGTGGVWPEGPHLYKKDGTYYLMIAEGGTSYNHCVTISRSDSSWGPFESCPGNPILTHAGRRDHPIQALGHADMVETPAGWWLVCLGIRPQGGRHHHLGRETFLAPVHWTGGWPLVGKAGTIELEMAAPKLKAQPWGEPAVRDEFDGLTLASAWNFLRNPRKADWSLRERPGYLRLRGSAVTLSDQDSPAFVGRRQTALECVAKAQLSFAPQQENEEAGLALRGNDANHVELGLTVRGGRRKLFVRKVLNGATAEPVTYVDAPPGDVTLCITATSTKYRFSASGGASGDDQTVTFGPADTIETQALSSETIGSFTGVYVGMYATGNGKESTVPADFDWFEFHTISR